jgi:hypothetical protein
MKTKSENTNAVAGRSKSTLLTSFMSKLSCTEPLRSFFTGILVAAGLAAAVAAPAWANTDSAADPESVALENWRAVMAQNPPREPGCFHESYPNLVRERVDCTTARPGVHPVHRTRRDGGPEVVGGGNDYVAYTPGGNTFWAGGSFNDVSVDSEETINVPFDGGESDGITGPNEYSLQINTNNWTATYACHGSTNSNCHVWQQFVYATDYGDCDSGGCDAGPAGVFMQYWLLNYGSGSCPSGWNQSGDDCWVNDNVVSAPDFPITDLANLSLHASAQFGGQDCAVLYDNTGAGWGVCFTDSMLDISEVWNKTEFGIFGDGGGSQAQFSSGTQFIALLQVNNGSGSAPTCLKHEGTTGETNNLTLGTCEPLVGNGLYPRIRFLESN